MLNIIRAIKGIAAQFNIAVIVSREHTRMARTYVTHHSLKLSVPLSLLLTLCRMCLYVYVTPFCVRHTVQTTNYTLATTDDPRAPHTELKAALGQNRQSRISQSSH